MTKEEKIKELEEQIQQKKKFIDYANASQMGLKLLLNSTYGSFANKYFVCSNFDIANAITSMGREIIQEMDVMVQKYFYNLWHKDKKLHRKLGLNEVTKIPETEPTGIYIDTDSVFVSYDAALRHCDWKGDELDFILKVNEYRMDGFFKKCLEKYAQRYGVENVQDFELEKVSESIIFLEKKRYVQNIVWEDGQHYQRLNEIIPKGVELVKSSTPPFVRDKCLELMEYLLDIRKNLSIAEVNKKIKTMKEEFKIADIEDISNTSSLGNYEKFVIEDKTDMKWQDGTPYHVKAAIFHNFLLNQNPELKTKYDYLKSGSKIRLYKTADRRMKYFAFQRGLHPHEFAPEVDYDAQFEKNVLSIVNMFLEAIGLPKINNQLKFRLGIFSDE